MSLVVTAAAQNGAPPQSQDVTFDGLDVRLAGTLTLPKLEAGKRAPAVLILGGAGVTPRDGLTFGPARHAIYRELAETLAAKGYASLRYDKRCVGASECRKAASFDDYIEDARGALEFLRKHERVDAKRIFLFGHSEGGLIASTLGANDERGLAGVTLAGSPGRNLSKLMRDWIQVRLADEKRPAEEVAASLAKYDRIVRGLTNGRGQFPDEKFDKNNLVDGVLLDWIGQYEVVVSLLINDPLQIAANIKSPVLILQGRKDLQVAVKDGQYLEEALKRVNHPDTTLLLLDDVDHLLKTNKGAATLASYADASRPLDTAMLTVLGEWMGKKAK
jgi:alpha-beta hydrolase superfamily lysophospholipase